jgi:hypothetical protein
MDLRRAIHSFMAQGRELIGRLHSQEIETVSRVDLHILEVQLYLLGKEVSRATKGHPFSTLNESQSHHPAPEFPPFVPDQDPKKEK